MAATCVQPHEARQPKNRIGVDVSLIKRYFVLISWSALTDPNSIALRSTRKCGAFKLADIWRATTNVTAQMMRDDHKTKPIRLKEG